MKSAQLIRSVSAVAIISLFAGCSTWDNLGTSLDTGMSTLRTNMSTGSTSTVRNTTNSGIDEIGTVATAPTYGGGTPRSAIAAGEVAAQEWVAMNARSSTTMLGQISPTTTAQSAPTTTAQSTPATTTQSAPPTSIQPSRSPQKVSDVRSAQQALKDDGYNVGPIDGKMGPKTAAALRKFQKDHGIQATGRLDSRTLAALAGSSGSSS